MAGLSPPGWCGAGSRAGACGSEEDEGEGLCLWGRLAGCRAWAAGPARPLLPLCPVRSRGPVPILVTAAVSWARWLCCSSATSCKPALARPCQSWQINSEKHKL